MALQVLRRNLQRLKWVLWFVILALSASMLLFFAGGPGGGSGTLTASELARVADHIVSLSEFRQRYSRSVEQFRNAYPQNMEFIKQMRLDQQVLSQLIREYAILVEGERLGIFATAQEVFDEIQTIPDFMEDGQFIGVDRYRDLLNRSPFTLRDFESMIGRSIVRRKLERMLTDGLEASPEEVRQAFVDRNQEVRVRYVAVNQGESMPEQLDEEELKAYYEENVNRYQGGEKRRAWTVRIEFRAPEMEVTQEEINEFLDDSEAQDEQTPGLAEFKARQRKAGQMAQELADKIVAEVQAGESLQEVAQRRQLEVQLSEPFEQGQPVPGATPIADFSNQIFNLAEQGRLTDPFLDSPGRMYLAQLEEIIPPQSLNFEAARSEVENDYKGIKGRELAEQKAKEVANAVRQGADFSAVAKENGLDLVSTEFFKNDQSTIDDTLKFSPLLRDQVFRMELNEVGVPVPVVDNFIAFQLIEQSPIDEERFEQEKGTLKDSLLQQKRTSFFSDYISKVLESLESAEQIERNLDLLAAITG